MNTEGKKPGFWFEWVRREGESIGSPHAWERVDYYCWRHTQSPYYEDGSPGDRERFAYCLIDLDLLDEASKDWRRVKCFGDYPCETWPGQVAFSSERDAIDALSDALIRIARRELKQGEPKS